MCNIVSDKRIMKKNKSFTECKSIADFMKIVNLCLSGYSE